jgi:2',3'-cyclic-nucleotide 2'-phosphodiesterase
MRILYCGDIVARSGREVVLQYLPKLAADHQLDLIVANGENAAHGFGITKSICQDLFKAGVDVITTGNHAWDQKEIISYIGQEKRLIRPINYPKGTPGQGFVITTTKKGQQALIINAMARLFMDPLDDPFAAVDAVLAKYPLGGAVKATLIDFHGEATSEKMAMGHFCDGRASLVVGSHSHIPTADAQILNKGTAYQTDAGMCGDYDSVIGMDKAVPLWRFTKKIPSERLSPAQGPGTLCGVYVETDDTTGLARKIAQVILGPRLHNRTID